MSAAFRRVAAGSILCLGLATCGGGGVAEDEAVSAPHPMLLVADSKDAPTTIVEPISNYVIPNQHSTAPRLYQLPAELVLAMPRQDD